MKLFTDPLDIVFQEVVTTGDQEHLRLLGLLRVHNEGFIDTVHKVTVSTVYVPGLVRVLNFSHVNVNDFQ